VEILAVYAGYQASQRARERRGRGVGNEQWTHSEYLLPGKDTTITILFCQVKKRKFCEKKRFFKGNWAKPSG
jgi:hypothetical protein